MPTLTELFVTADSIQTSIKEFKATCAKEGQEAKCCVLPVVSIFSTDYAMRNVHYDDRMVMPLFAMTRKLSTVFG